MPDDWRYFLLGVCGSLAVELVRVARVFETGRTLSVRYQRPVYLVCRFLIAAAGGVMAWAYHVNSDIVAIQIGASAPILLQQSSVARADNDADGPSSP